MITRLFLTLIICMALLPAAAMAQGKPIFRNFVWGVSPADVKKFESALYYDNKDGLSFFEDTNEGRVVYRYYFKDKKLWRIRVSYQELHRPVPRQVLDLTADEQEKLKKLFGKPIRDELIWKDMIYRKIGPWFERAYDMGKVQIETEWQTDETNILLRSYKGDPYYELTYRLENRKAAEEAVQGFELFKFNE